MKGKKLVTTGVLWQSRRFDNMKVVALCVCVCVKKQLNFAQLELVSCTSCKLKQMQVVKIPRKFVTFYGLS